MNIKVIELLNKIANGEKAPKKIKILGVKFEWFEGCYRSCDVLRKYLSDCWRLDNILNDTVEIIEEQQDIDIQETQYLDLEKYSFDVTDGFAIDIVLKINEIIDEVKQLENNKQDKE